MMNFERTFVKPTLFSFAIFSSSLPPPPLCALFSCLWDGSATRNTNTLPFSTPCFFRGGVVGGGGTREKLWGRQFLHTNRIYLLPTFYPSFTQVLFTFRISVTLNLPFNWSANWNGLQHTHTKNNCTALIQIDFLGCVSLLKSKSRFLIQQRIFRFFHKIQKWIIDPNDPQRRWILWIVFKTGYTIHDPSRFYYGSEKINTQEQLPAVTRNCLTTLLIFTAIFVPEPWIKQQLLSVLSGW